MNGKGELTDADLRFLSFNFTSNSQTLSPSTLVKKRNGKTACAEEDDVSPYENG